MNPAISASQFKSWYSQATAPNSATVNAILINSPMKNDIGLAFSALCAFANNRSANKLFGTTQHKPPKSAENNAGIPPTRPAIPAAMIVVANCKRTMRSILFQIRASSKAP